MTYSFAAGTVFTLILIAIYVPAALEFRRRARALAIKKIGARSDAKEKSYPPAARDIERWMKRHGLYLSWSQTFNQVLAALGPIVAGGPIAALLSQTD